MPLTMHWGGSSCATRHTLTVRSIDAVKSVSPPLDHSTEVTTASCNGRTCKAMPVSAHQNRTRPSKDVDARSGRRPALCGREAKSITASSCPVSVRRHASFEASPMDRKRDSLKPGSEGRSSTARRMLRTACSCCPSAWRACAAQTWPCTKRPLNLTAWSASRSALSWSPNFWKATARLANDAASPGSHAIASEYARRACSVSPDARWPSPLSRAALHIAIALADAFVAPRRTDCPAGDHVARLALATSPGRGTPRDCACDLVPPPPSRSLRMH